jgi:hypothetical protein
MKTIAFIIAAIFFLAMLVAVATTNSPFANWANKKLEKFFRKEE